MTVPSIDVLCNQAREAIAARNWEQARQAYQQALSLKSDSPDIHQGLATVYFQLRDLLKAVHHFREVTRLDPHRAVAFINLGAIYNLLDQMDDAVNALRKGIQIDPQRSEGYYNLGLVYRRKGQADLAVHAYREAIRLNPRAVDAHYNLGNLYLEKEAYGQATECYRHALQLRPGWEKASQGLAVAQEAMADLQEQADLEQTPPPPVAAPQPVKKLDPNRTISPEHQGVLLNALHKATGEAEEQSKKMLEFTQEGLIPVIEELSKSLINPSVSITTLDQCIQHFEEVMRNARALRDRVGLDVQKVRMLGDQLVAESS